MKQLIEIAIGDVVEMKKTHPCGSKTWEVFRVGADIGLQCSGCGHRIMMPRQKLAKAIRKP